MLHGVRFSCKYLLNLCSSCLLCICIGFWGCLTGISLVFAVWMLFSLAAYSMIFVISERMWLTVFGAKPFAFAPPEVKSSLPHRMIAEREISETGLFPKAGNRYKSSRLVCFATLEAFSRGVFSKSHSLDSSANEPSFLWISADFSAEAASNFSSASS